MSRIFKPHKTIGESYLERWHLVPRNRWFNVYLHKFSGSDDDRALHDHPWESVSFLISGRLLEIYDPGNGNPETSRMVPWMLPVFRRAEHLHRLVLTRGPAWTVFVTGPRRRLWGFHCHNGWKPWHQMTDAVGRMIGGCD